MQKLATILRRQKHSFQAAFLRWQRKTASRMAARRVLLAAIAQAGARQQKTAGGAVVRRVLLEVIEQARAKGWLPAEKAIPYKDIPKNVAVPDTLSRGTVRPYTLDSAGRVSPADLPPGSSSVQENLKPLPGAKGQTWYAGDVDTAARNAKATDGTITFFRPDQIGQFPNPKSLRPEELRMLTNEVIGRPPVGANPVAAFLRQNEAHLPQRDSFIPLTPATPPSSNRSIPGLDARETFATIWGEAKQLGVHPVLYNRVYTLQPRLLQEIKQGTLDIEAITFAIKSQLDSLPGRHTRDGIARHKQILKNLEYLEQAHKTGNKADQIKYLAQVLLD